MRPQPTLENITRDQLLSIVKEIVREEIQTNTNQPKQFLTPQEAADFLSKSRATVYRLTSTRQIPFFKRQNSIYFDRKELEAWLRGGKKVSVEHLS